MYNLLRNTLLVLALCVAFSANAQDAESIIENVEEALKASSSKELTKHLHSKVEIKLDGVRKEYSVNQAEIVLKKFFQQHPADSFEFIHDGDNDSGARIYAIGTYKSASGKHRVVIRAKEYNKVYKVYRLEFTKDR
ncbi:DUF4783 domain-containing protein [Roseivirga sp. E12]|uniref:DUF4783 domain-containing protein n=1 Tax=Roseivirga sp. E12 TaxID=2819237 RepID=UPI001ABC0A63|nr:DUF4783 domain-containing protein [Roseivirga sp. E12]MBO3699835.1 DUF4783 domain-containing protein [Roseivirga sp. E12]